MRHPTHFAVLALAVLLGSTAPSPACADDVYLTNGQVFEGVVARRDGETVRIRLPQGEMGLPAAWVERIEEADSVLSRYLERKASLEPGGTAEEWLDLARWARAHGAAEGAREAALRAAAIDPRLEGLTPILQAAGYTFDAEAGEWLTESRWMSRRGYVRVGSEWVPASVVAERARAEREARAAADRAVRDERLEQAITLLALSQLEEAREEATRPVVPVVDAHSSYLPIAVFPGTFHLRPRPHPGGHHPRPPRRDEPPPVHEPRRNRGGFSYDALAGRQPGSIIPIAADPGAERNPP